MKKFIYTTLAAVAVLFFASCKNDKNQPKKDKADAFVSFTFSLPQGDTRAEASDVEGANGNDTYVGTKAEQAINGVRVVLYDPSSGKVKYAFNYNIAGNGTQAPAGTGIAPNASPATTARFTTKAEGVTSQDYLMLAIINPTAEVNEATAEGKTLVDAQTAITSDVDKLSVGGIMMSNDRGLVKVAASAMKNTDVAAEQSPIAVSVDRILAKVFVGGKPALPTGAKFTDMKWVLNTTNKKTFIYRQFGQVVTAKNNFAIETATDASHRFDRYAEDPNFSGTFNWTEFNYLEGTPALTKETGYDDAKGQYCLENTMAAKSQQIRQTTSFILSGIWTPADRPAVDGRPAVSFTEGKTWYSYQGFTFTPAMMKAYIEEANDASKNTLADINYTPAGFKAALKNLLELADCPVKKTDGDATKSFVNFDIKGYKDGVCYYQSNLIRHFNNDQSSLDMGYGRYGVVRNNIYKIKLTKISAPGEPTVVNDKDKDKDDDPAKVFVSFDVTINPWIVRTQEISL